MIDFTRQLPVGPDDFQIAVVTYSHEAELAWDFVSYTSNITLIEALGGLNCSGGATMTDKALKLAWEVNISVDICCSLCRVEPVVRFPARGLT